MAIGYNDDMIVNGRWTQVGVSFRSHRSRKRSAVFECECGVRRIILVHDVTSGHSWSCGCYKKETLTKHGYTNDPVFLCWRSMIKRCYNDDDANYKNYGERGIKVCDRWLESFENFKEDMGDRQSGMSIDRVDNSLGYCKENCRWATCVEQSRNTRSNRLLEINGKIKCVAEWSEESGLSRHLIYHRLDRGWSAEDAVFTKPDTRFSHVSRKEGG